MKFLFSDDNLVQSCYILPYNLYAYILYLTLLYSRWRCFESYEISRINATYQLFKPSNKPSCVNTTLKMSPTLFCPCFQKGRVPLKRHIGQNDT